MPRKSSLLCLKSNRSHLFNLVSGAYLADEEDLFAANQVSNMATRQDVIFRNTWEVLWKKFLGSFGSALSFDLVMTEGILSAIESFHVTSRRPQNCGKFLWCMHESKLRNGGHVGVPTNLRELNSILMQILSFLCFGWKICSFITWVKTSTLSVCVRLLSVITWSYMWP